MARHRSPRGRTAIPRPAASRSPRRRAPQAGDAVRSVPESAHPLPPTQAEPPAGLAAAPDGSARPDRRRALRHGAAVALAAGGVVSVVGAAAPLAGPLTAGVQDAATAFAGPLDGATGTGSTGGGTAAGPAPVTGSAIAGGALAALPAGAAEAGVTPALPVSLTVLSDAARTAGERATAEQQRAADAAAAAERAGTERARAALSGRAVSSGSTSCGIDTSGLGAVKPWVETAAEFLGCQFGQPQLLGVGSRGNASDHPTGLALDLMTSNQATGDAIAACALKNMDALGVSYVIWNQQINTGSGWKAMEDRGSPTANHEDHVHVSFQKSAGSGNTVTC